MFPKIVLSYIFPNNFTAASTRSAFLFQLSYVYLNTCLQMHEDIYLFMGHIHAANSTLL